MIISKYYGSLIATATASALTDNESATVGGVHQSRRLPNAIAEKTAEVAATPSNRSARQAADSESEPKQKPRNRMSQRRVATLILLPQLIHDWRRATRECAASVRSPRRFISNCSATGCLPWHAESLGAASLVWNVFVCVCVDCGWCWRRVASEFLAPAVETFSMPAVVVDYETGEREPEREQRERGSR